MSNSVKKKLFHIRIQTSNKLLKGATSYFVTRSILTFVFEVTVFAVQSFGASYL
jgi:hypothetical protein